MGMKTHTIIKTTALILALITVSITTAAAVSCDCSDICVNTDGWRRVPCERSTDTGSGR